jgi:UPF0716 protein FxsA
MLLLLLFVLVPAVELALLIEVGRHLGVLATVALILGTGVAGAALARAQGVRAFRRVRETLRSGGFPGEELLDSALILAGGLLLLAPGLITDLVGLAALVPGTRRLLKACLKRFLRRRLWPGAIEVEPRAD